MAMEANTDELGLWLYATLQGVGSGRQLSRLVLEHDAYRWISGGVQVNHHSLSDFRVAHGAALGDLLGTSLAALMAAGAVKLERVAQDGVRVRTDAGAASFRRKGCLQDNLEQARARVRELKAQLQADPAQDSRHTTVAQQRARCQIQQRVQDALDRMSELEAIKRGNGGKSEARASTTNAEANVLKMADGGFRPAYNTQFASDCDSQVIVWGWSSAPAARTWRNWRRWSSRSSSDWVKSPRSGWSTGAFLRMSRLMPWSHKTEVYAPVPEPRSKKDDEGNQIEQDKHQPSPRTARPWRSGARAW